MRSRTGRNAACTKPVERYLLARGRWWLRQYCALVSLLGIFEGATLVGEVSESNTSGAMPQGSSGDWNRVLGRMRREVGETAYRSWFGSMTVVRSYPDELSTCHILRPKR